MVEDDFRSGRLRVDGYPIHCVAARRIATVGPVKNPIPEVQLEVDRFGQMIEYHFDVAAVGRCLALWDVDASAS